MYCVKSVRIRSYSGPYFPAFELNMERYSVSLRIKSESEKVRTRKNYLFGYFSRSDCSVLEYQKEGSCVLYYKRSLDYLQKICHNITYLPLTVT